MIHILVIMLIRGSAPRCGGMSAREALPPRLGPVSGRIYKKRFTYVCVCVCYTKFRNTQVFRVKKMLAYIEIISSLCCKFTTFSANLQEKLSKITKKSHSASII